LKLVGVDEHQFHIGIIFVFNLLKIKIKPSFF
jgi:hypothetical protein